MLIIDGSMGEGGGQILRSALSLAMCTQTPFRIEQIRANRAKPGLMRQHLTAVRSAAAICSANVQGAVLGSQALSFHPRAVEAGSYQFNIGTAGSCTLVLQTVLIPLLMADRASDIRITGGTHNQGAPCFDFLASAFVPQLRRMGADIDLELLRHGFYPRGGGVIRATVRPADALARLELQSRGAPRDHSATATVSGIAPSIAERELDTVQAELGWQAHQLRLQELPAAHGPGNVVTLTMAFDAVTEIVFGLGKRGVRAEQVATQACQQAREYLNAAAPVGAHLADQLLLPMALGDGGSFSACEITAHFRSNAQVIEAFTGRSIETQKVAAGYQVTVR